jgi:hypothetical protein
MRSEEVIKEVIQVDLTIKIKRAGKPALLM